MKREILTQYLFFLTFFIFVGIRRDFFSWQDFPFWLGGAVGVLMPYLDYLFYSLFVNPQELSWQRFRFYLQKKQFLKAGQILVAPDTFHSYRIFHNFFFQLVFLLLTFWVLASSANLFAVGLVLAFSLHLFIDQLADFLVQGSLDSWTGGLLNLEIRGTNQVLYWVGLFLVFLAFGFLF